MDATSSSDCTINFSRYNNRDYDRVVWTTDVQPCEGRAAVIHTFPVGEGGGASTNENEYVELTGNAETDRQAIDQLIADVSPLSDDPGPTLGGGDGESGGGDSTRCQDGVYPQWWRATGSYLIYKWDGGPVDTRMRYAVYLKRISCTKYLITKTSQWLDDRDPAEQRLWWESYGYTKSVHETTIPIASQGYNPCKRHPRGSGPISRIDFQPNNWDVVPNGRYVTKTTNDNVADCIYWGETWTGEVRLDLPQS